eukprot:CAMPEP_0116139244 /NCGR_PEP_ID=MMETSP0329-20121206/13205_1 /TAXON_ID=697910 /ORGANISM="Pseudo-nitzschia arenysensis, Strain B593" /LENGTH=230 /DNA_ID=CAMNT_0003634267 /DNA_START=114 /DNA_END=806 /DNA_ORIENTATION=-
MIPSIFIPIDLEASLGKIEDSNERKRKASQEQPSSPSAQQESGTKDEIQPPRSKCIRTGITRTSSRTPFVTEAGDETEKSGKSTSLLKPYPISESDTEIRERKRLTESVDWSNGLVVNSPPTTSMNAAASSSENADQQSMMEVTVDDFVLSPEEARSVTDLDNMTIQDQDFWETPVQVANTLTMNASDVGMMNSVPFSVTFSSQDPCIDDLNNEDELADAAPIRSVDMEW